MLGSWHSCGLYSHTLDSLSQSLSVYGHRHMQRHWSSADMPFGLSFRRASDGITGSVHWTIAWANLDSPNSYHADKQFPKDGFIRFSVLLKAGEPFPCLSLERNTLRLVVAVDIVATAAALVWGETCAGVAPSMSPTAGGASGDSPPRPPSRRLGDMAHRSD